MVAVYLQGYFVGVDPQSIYVFDDRETAVKFSLDVLVKTGRVSKTIKGGYQVGPVVFFDESLALAAANSYWSNILKIRILETEDRRSRL